MRIVRARLWLVIPAVLAFPAQASAESFTFRPVADTYMRSDMPSASFGTSSTLRVDKEPISHAYLRFDVQGLQGPVTRATLRLKATTDASDRGVDLRAVADNSWGETTLTYSNAPPVSGTITAHTGAFASGQWISLDATALVGGNGPVSMAVTTTSSTSRSFQSREDVVSTPELVIEATDIQSPAVTLDTPGDGALSGAGTPTFSGGAGIAQGDSSTLEVKLYAGPSATGAPVRTLTATRAGAFWLASLAEPLDDGTYTAQAEQADASGNVGSSTASTFTVASGAPEADVSAPAVTLAEPAGGSSVVDPTPSVSGAAGTAEGDARAVFVSLYSGDSVSGTPLQTLSATETDGAWSVTASAPLAEGTYTARAEQADTAGNLGQSAPTTFRVTAPVVAAAGDIACDPANTKFNGGLGKSATCRQQYTSDLLVGLELAAVLPLGDEQYECAGYSAFLRSYALSWGRVKGISRPVLGNHEYQSSVGTDCDATGKAGGYFDYFGSSVGDAGTGYYSYDLGSWHIIALNSNDTCKIVPCGAGSAQEQWLKADLAAHPAECTLAYWHAPRFRSGQSSPTGAYKALWNALYAARADVVVNAHFHNYERFAPQDPSGNADPATGLREFVVGTGGASHAAFGTTIQANSEVREGSTFGILKLTLHGGSYDWEFTPEGGSTFRDSGSTNCH